jgi:phosphoribosylanthranilate isomerase
VNLPRRTRVKFCGMTSPEDVELAVAAGADAVGVICAESPRRVALDDLPAIAASIPPYVFRVGVIADQTQREADALRALGFTLQFSGDESPAECEALSGGDPYIKVFHVDAATGLLDVAACAAYTRALWMLDTRVAAFRGGTGVTFDWGAAEPFVRSRRVVVSGGLTPENVGACVRALGPYAVDVRSGIETGGCKDGDKMRAFMVAVANAR